MENTLDSNVRLRIQHDHFVHSSKIYQAWIAAHVRTNMHDSDNEYTRFFPLKDPSATSIGPEPLAICLDQPPAGAYPSARNPD